MVDKSIFPDPETADPMGRGLVAIGGNLSVATLIDAYSHGIFPWPDGEPDSPLFWFSLDPRMVLLPHEFRYSDSLRRIVRSGKFVVRIDSCFEQVVRACSRVPRDDQDGTWITDDIIAAYVALHRAGYAHSFETFLDGVLVGGLYGVSLGAFFCGESMFHTVRDASKVAFVRLVEYASMHNFRFIDAQQPTRHLASLGAKEMPRKQFLKLLSETLNSQNSRNPQIVLNSQNPPSCHFNLQRPWPCHSVVLSLGGNQGDIRHTICEALQRLQAAVGPLSLCSPLYESEPWGFDRPVPNFLNICAVFETDLSPRQVLQSAMQIEKALGRQRPKESEIPANSECSQSSEFPNISPIPLNPQPSPKNYRYSSRPIDIDILFYDSQVISEPDLAVPHPRLPLRRFVLHPLADLMPRFQHPLLKKTMAELLEECDDKGWCNKTV